MRLSPLLLLPLLPPTLALTLYHRLSPTVPFSPRGALSLSPSGSYTPLSSAPLSGQAEVYQVGVDLMEGVEGWKSGERWAVAWAPCAPRDGGRDTVTVHVGWDGRPHSIAYAAEEGVCDREEGVALDTAKLNTTVLVTRPSPVPLPKLREPAPPPQLGADGKPLPKPEEKSFIQKYWMYIVPIFLVLLLAPGEEGDAGGKVKR